MLEQRKNELLNPKNDVVFQTLFSRGKESITKDLLEKILKIKINKIDLDKSKDLQNNNIGSKNGRIDLRAILNDNIECDVEIQLEKHEKMLERFLLYWAKMYSVSLKRGEEYNRLRKTISIIIVDDEIPEFKKINKYQTNWQIREEEYTNFVLTDYLQICIIELPRAIKAYENNKENEVLQWMKFLNNPKDREVLKIVEENEKIKEAKEELDRISQDDMLVRMAIKAEMEEFDRKQIMYEAVRDAKNEGRQEGKLEGKLEGAKEKQLEIVKSMLKKNINILDIIEITGLTKEEIEKLK